MKPAILVTMLLLALCTTAAQAAICLRVSEIKSTDSPDGKVLTVAMKDGKVWQNQLQRPCPGLRFSGFAWKVDTNLVCENAQHLRVLQSGLLCSLGKFTQLSAAAKK